MSAVTIKREIWGGLCAAYLRPGRIEVHLPEWSGRLTNAEARRGLAALRTLIDDIEAAISALEETAT